MAESNFNETVGALFKGMDSFISAKTVVGEAVKFDDGTIILPLIDVSFGVGAGAYQGHRNSAGGGMGGKMTPNSVLVIQDGKTRLVTVKNQNTVSKIVDMVPEVLEFFKKTKADKEQEKEMDRKGSEYIDENMK